MIGDHADPSIVRDQNRLVPKLNGIYSIHAVAMFVTGEYERSSCPPHENSRSKLQNVMRNSSGKTDADADYVEVPNFNATIAHALGLPRDQVVRSPSNRPFTVANKAEPITSLF